MGKKPNRRKVLQYSGALASVGLLNNRAIDRATADEGKNPERKVHVQNSRDKTLEFELEIVPGQGNDNSNPAFSDTITVPANSKTTEKVRIPGGPHKVRCNTEFDSEELDRWVVPKPPANYAELYVRSHTVDGLKIMFIEK